MKLSAHARYRYSQRIDNDFDEEAFIRDVKNGIYESHDPNAHRKWVLHKHKIFRVILNLEEDTVITIYDMSKEPPRILMGIAMMFQKSYSKAS